jgi:hypothetical protein
MVEVVSRTWRRAARLCRPAAEHGARLAELGYSVSGTLENGAGLDWFEWLRPSRWLIVGGFPGVGGC